MNSYRDNLARTLMPVSPRRDAHTANNPATEPASPAVGTQRSLRLQDVVREHISHVLKLSDWVIEGPRGAAALLGMKPSTLRYRIRLLNIQRPPRTEVEEPVTFIFRNNRIPFRT